MLIYQQNTILKIIACEYLRFDLIRKFLTYLTKKADSQDTTLKLNDGMGIKSFTNITVKGLEYFLTN